MGYSLKRVDSDMDIEQQFNDLGVDAVIGTELMNLLGLNQYDIMDTPRFIRFQEVIQYFKNQPERSFVINKLTIGKMVDKLDHVWGYIELQRQKAQYEIETMKAQINLNSIDKDDPNLAEKYDTAQAILDDALNKMNITNEQSLLYER